MKQEIKIKSLWKWWKHPIRWYKDRKKIKLMNIMANHWYQNGGSEEVSKMTVEAIIYGTAISKDGVRINPFNLSDKGLKQ